MLALPAIIRTDTKRSNTVIENKADTIDEKKEQSESTAERFHRILVERAAAVVCARNDVYTTKWWQLVINFVLGCTAIAFLIMSMVTDGMFKTVSAFSGVGFVIVFIGYNYVVRSVTPASFLQYTHRTETGYARFMIISKTRAVFSDGEHTIESNRNTAAMLGKPLFPEYCFDFFADMDVEMRIATENTETFKGVCTCNGKQYKCKIVFKADKPIYGVVDGCRIKYFDVNNTKEKFVVPATLKHAAKTLNVFFPKVPGLYIRDDIKDATKQ